MAFDPPALSFYAPELHRCFDCLRKRLDNLSRAVLGWQRVCHTLLPPPLHYLS